MKGSHLAVAGGVFVAVLVVCFAFVGFGAKGEATAKPDAVGVSPANPVDPTPPEPLLPSLPSLPTPKPPAGALGGFGLVAKLERGYDGTAFLAASSISVASRIATWRLPAADVAGFGDTYRDIRLTADRFVAVSDAGVRVLDARTGEPTRFGVPSANTFPETALSPRGDWAVQATAAGVTLFDLSGGIPAKVAASAKRTLTGPAGFGADNDWCAVLGQDGGKPAVFRVRKDGSVDLIGHYRPDTTRGQASRVARLYATVAGGRIVVERPAEKSPTPRLLAWDPLTPALVPLPSFSPETHDDVQHVRLSGNGRHTAFFDNTTMKVYDLDTGRSLMTHQPSDMTLADAAFTPSGERLVVAYRWRRVAGDPENGEAEKTLVPARAVVFDVKRGETVGRSLSFEDLGVGKAGVRRCVLSADGTRLAVVEVSGAVHLVDTVRAFGDGVRGDKPTPPVTGTEPTPRPAPNKPDRGLADS